MPFETPDGSGRRAKTKEFGFKEAEVLVIYADAAGEITKKDLDVAREAARDIDKAESRVKAIVERYDAARGVGRSERHRRARLAPVHGKGGRFCLNSHRSRAAPDDRGEPGSDPDAGGARHP